MKKIEGVTIGLALLILAGCAAIPEDKKVGQLSQEAQSVSGDYISEKISRESNVHSEKSPELSNNSANQMDILKKYQFAEINTNLGKIQVKLFGADAPLTAANFLKLAEEKFYDGTKFHRVIKGFMIQGGDPFSKEGDPATWGQGGPGYTIPAEIKLKNRRGTLATARLGDQMNPKRESSGSQFYINTVDNVFLDGQYTVFGEVIEGMDVVDKIESAKTGTNDRPVENVVIKSITPLEK